MCLDVVAGYLCCDMQAGEARDVLWAGDTIPDGVTVLEQDGNGMRWESGDT